MDMSVLYNMNGGCHACVHLEKMQPRVEGSISYASNRSAIQCGPETGLHGFLNFCIYKKFEFDAFFGLI